MRRIKLFFALLLISTLSACSFNNTIEETPGETQAAENSGSAMEPILSSETPALREDEETSGTQTIEKEPSGDDDTDELREKFGEDCIADQTFEVELSEYDGKVWFVPFAPSAANADFRIQLIRDGEILAELPSYIPDSAARKPFGSLDAVSFSDINYDGCTDIVLIETYGDTHFAAVYYGFDADAEEYETSFFPEQYLSEMLSAQVTPLTIPGIRDTLSGGKKNGEFADYREAYRAVSRFCALEESAGLQYDLIYLDEDDTPELVCSVNGYRTSLYTFDAGRVYTLMDRWPYGAMGNAGYEYSAGKNSLRNYNSDFAGAIVYTTYLAVNERHALDTVVQIETYQFDDVNGNGMPDEDEQDSVGFYNKSYIDGREVSDEECASYAVGEYTYLEGVMDLTELHEKLN